MPGNILTKITIEGTDVSTHKISYKVEKTRNNQLRKATIFLSVKVLETLAITERQSVVITRGFTTNEDQTIFIGQITKKINEGGLIELECEDMLIEAKKANITASYDYDIHPTAGVVSEIFKDVIANYTPLIADDSSIVNSGTLNIIHKFICKDEDALTTLERLADVLGWQFYFNVEDEKVHFEPKGLDTYANTLTAKADVATNIISVPKWTSDSSSLANKIIIHGASQLDNRTERFDGDGSEKVFELLNTPEDTEVYVDDVLLKRGIEGVSTDYDYTVNEDRKEIKFEDAPGVGSDNVVINYGTNIPIPVVLTDFGSINTYGGVNGTPSIKVIHEQDIKTVFDAELKGRSYLNKYSTPFLSTSFRVKDLIDIEIGMLVNVVDNINNKEGSFIVTKITMRYPYNGDEVEIGDKELRLEDWTVDIANNLKKIQEELTKNQDILVQVIDLGMEIDFRRKSLKIERRTINDGFIIGSTTRGIIGTDKIGYVDVTDWETLVEEDY